MLCHIISCCRCLTTFVTSSLEEASIIYTKGFQVRFLVCAMPSLSAVWHFLTYGNRFADCYYIDNYPSLVKKVFPILVFFILLEYFSSMTECILTINDNVYICQASCSISDWTKREKESIILPRTRPTNTCINKVKLLVFMADTRRTRIAAVSQTIANIMMSLYAVSGTQRRCEYGLPAENCTCPFVLFCDVQLFGKC
jgi:hypothetical protein